MEINVKKIGKVWTVQFTHKAQTFTLDYHVPTEEEAQWMKIMLAKCFTSAFGENWNENKTLPIMSEVKEFLKECKEVRNNFAKIAGQYSVSEHLKLRTEIDSLLIMYDQLCERVRLEDIDNKNSRLNSPDVISSLLKLEQLENEYIKYFHKANKQFNGIYHK